MKIIGESVFSMHVCPACGHRESLSLRQGPDRFHGRRRMYRLVQCSLCSLVRTENPPPPSEIGDHYGVQYDKSVSKAGEDPCRWRARCEVVARYKVDGGTILDIGCSSGDFLGSLKGPNWRRYGVEMSEMAANIARSRRSVEVFVGDVLDAPFAQCSFDVITCFHVLEHMYQPRAVLERVSAWLKPGGIFYVMVPNIESAGARLFGSCWYALELPRHICHFSPGSLTNLASVLGLESVSVTTHRELFLEQSTKYLVDEMRYRAGMTPVPLARARSGGVVRRAFRKGFRLSLLPVLEGLACLVGRGESIHAILKKPLLPEQSTGAERLMLSRHATVQSED